MVLHWSGLLLATTIVMGPNGSPWTVLILWLVWQSLLARWAHEVSAPSPTRPAAPAFLVGLLAAVFPLPLVGVLIAHRHRVVAVPATALEPERKGAVWLWTGTCCTAECADEGDLVVLSDADGGGHHLTRIVARPTTAGPDGSPMDCSGPHALRSGSMGTHGGNAEGPWHARAAITGLRQHIVWARTPEPELVPIPDLSADRLLVSRDLPLPDSRNDEPVVVNAAACLGRATHILWADDLSLVGRRL